jgi:FMN phosphatase YigB (HAD superfamily)
LFGDGVKRADTNASTVFFFDVDNTLLDNDRVAEDLKLYLIGKVGETSQRRYWEIFEQLRTSWDMRTIWARCSVIAWSGRAIRNCLRSRTS